MTCARFCFKYFLFISFYYCCIKAVKGGCQLRLCGCRILAGCITATVTVVWSTTKIHIWQENVESIIIFFQTYMHLELLANTSLRVWFILRFFLIFIYKSTGKWKKVYCPQTVRTNKIVFSNYSKHLWITQWSSIIFWSLKQWYTTKNETSV